MMRRLIPILAIAMSAMSACTNNDLTGPSGSIVGSWNLRTINGSSLPYSIGNAMVTSEQLTLNSDGTYTDIAYYSNGNSFVERGYYTQNNNAITFNDQTDNIVYSGSISGDVLTEISGQFTSTYQRN